MKSDGSFTWRNGGAPARGEGKHKISTSPNCETLCYLARNDDERPIWQLEREQERARGVVGIDYFASVSTNTNTNKKATR
jgi:hypothetical protein